MTPQLDDESLARILANQEVAASDFMMMQKAIQGSVDGIVSEALGFNEGYVGLGVAKESDTSVQVAVGRYYKNGPRYRLVAPLSLDFLPHIPTLGNKRVVSIGVSGVEIDTEVADRRFVTDATVSPPITEPRPTQTRTRREVAVSLVPGIQGTAPLNPNIPASILEIARVTLSETGIIGTPEQVIEKRLKSLFVTQADVDAQSDMLEQFEGQLASLRSDIAGIVREIEEKPSAVAFRNLTRNVAQLNERIDIPDVRIGFGLDWFENDNESNTAHPNYDAFIGQHLLQFPREAASNQAAALLNPVDPKVVQASNGLTLPAYTSSVLLAQRRVTGGLRPLDSTQGNWTLKTNGLGRVWYFYGAGQNIAELRAELNLRSVVRVFDPAANAFATINLATAPYDLRMDFFNQSFARVVENDPYPDDDARKTSEVIAGAAVAQTFMNGGFRWITGVNLLVKEKGASGPIQVGLCRLKRDGTPDLSNIKARGTVAYADIKTWPETTPVSFPSPAYLRAGRGFAVVAITTGGHVLGTASLASVAQRFKGQLFAAGDGVHFTHVAGQELSVELVFASFASARAIVELDSLQLVGGVTNLDLAFEGTEPKGTNIVAQGQIGGVWRNIDHTDLTAFATAPNLIPLRLVFNGSDTVMPALRLGATRMIGWRPKPSLTHISNARTLAAPSSDIVVTLHTRDFDDAKHDLAVKLLHGVGYGSTQLAAATAIHDTRDNRVKRIVASFAPVPAISDFKIRIEGLAATANDAFVVKRRADVEK